MVIIMRVTSWVFCIVLNCGLQKKNVFGLKVNNNLVSLFFFLLSSLKIVNRSALFYATCNSQVAISGTKNDGGGIFDSYF